MKHWIADSDGNMDPADEKEIAAAFPELSEKIGPLAESHAELVVCPTKSGPAVFRVPIGQEYERFLGALLGDNKEGKVKASRNLAGACVVYPDRTTFLSWVDRYPGIPSACTKPLNKLMGGELVARGKD